MGRATGSTRVARRGRDVERVAVLPVCEVDGDDVSQMGAGHGLAEEVRQGDLARGQARRAHAHAVTLT